MSRIDDATKQIDAINRNLKAMQAPAERLTKSFSKLRRNIRHHRLSHGMKDVADASFSAFENLGPHDRAAWPLTGAASIAGLSRLVTGFANSGAELYRLGSARASAPETSLPIKGAADLAGSSSAAMGAGIKTLNDNMFHALQGTAPEAIIAFNKLHIAWRIGQRRRQSTQASRISCRGHPEAIGYQGPDLPRADRHDAVWRRCGGPGASPPADQQAVRGIRSQRLE